MNKVICDVCGTDYPETATQCPICGCARGDGGQTSAGNASEEDVRNYTYVKGGRFSKSNVRKRLKAQAQQAAIREEELNKPLPEDEDIKKSDDYDDEDEEYDDDDMEGVSNKGLILIVILLLLAIIAVSSYIAVTFFGGDDDPDATRPSQQTTEATQPSATEPTVTEPVVVGTPCTGLVLNDLSIELVNYNAPWELDFMVEPADTTDTVIFTSSDPSIVTVDDNGVVKGVGNGEATITVSCGEFQAVCNVTCQLQDLPVDPSQGTDPTDPTDPTQGTTEPADPALKLELNRDDFTLSAKGASWQVHKGDVPRDQIQWSSDDETVATVEDGKVVAVGPGTTTIRAKYGDQEVTCIVRCSFQVETEPTEPEPTEPEPTEPEPTEPEPTEPEPTEPDETALRVNGNAPKYTYNDKANSADVSLVVGEEYKCVLSVEGADGVTWTSSDSSIATVEDNGTIVPKSEGKATLTATVDGVEYIVMVRVSE